MKLDKSCKTCEFWNGEGCRESGVTFRVADTEKEKSCWHMSLAYFSEVRENKNQNVALASNVV
ncbi:MAG: hypothetical protein H7X94_07815 [Vallitaleaceae bacterium]|nr:hypothetical protein [Vallitaleaceae bacterium]